MGKSRHAGQWKPGVSGNPSGRPKIVGEVMELARQWTVKAIETLAEIMQDIGAPKAARVAAASAILDRGYGKPPQALEHSGNGVTLLVTTGIPRAPNEPLELEADEPEGSLH